jgi:hypothetical protein
MDQLGRILFIETVNDPGKQNVVVKREINRKAGDIDACS